MYTMYCMLFFCPPSLPPFLPSLPSSLLLLPPSLPPSLPSLPPSLQQLVTGIFYQMWFTAPPPDQTELFTKRVGHITEVVRTASVHIHVERERERERGKGYVYCT